MIVKKMNVRCIEEGNPDEINECCMHDCRSVLGIRLSTKSVPFHGNDHNEKASARQVGE
jgi:hypothetical protein